MQKTVLSEKIHRGVNWLARETDNSRTDIITRLASSVDAARSTVRQDVHGYIKKPSIDRLRAYSDVLGFSTRDFLRMAAQDGIVYEESWVGVKMRDTARGPDELEYSDTSMSEQWDESTWTEWKEELDLPEDMQWDEASQEVHARIAKATAYGEASADTFTDANTYPLIDATGTLVFGALDSAWKLAGRAPNPDSLRSTVETLANREFDESFESDESSLMIGGKEMHVDMSVPAKIENAAQAFLDAKDEDLVPESCGTGTGTRRANKIANDDLSWKDFLTRDNGTPIPAYLNSHEEDVSAEGPPTDWNEEEWSDCGNAQMAAWGFYADWFKKKANEIARARDEEEPYKSRSEQIAQKRVHTQPDNETTDVMSLKSATPSDRSVDPFTEKVNEEDTFFKGSPQAEIKDVDRSSNVIRAYYAAWTEDAHDERFTKGAFEDSIQRFGPPSEKQRIVHLNQHMTNEPIGVPIEMTEDDHGLLAKTRISETRLGEDVLTLYDDGVITEHSVGFKKQETEKQEDGPTLITKALLLEGSNVTWGANSDTPFMGFKSAEEAVPALADRLKSLRRALRDGLTDAVAKSVEESLGHVESQLRTILKQSASAFEENDHTNAEAVEQESIDRAVRSFEEQLSTLEDTKGKKRHSSDWNEDLGEEILTFDLHEEESEDDDLVVPDEMSLFGITNG